MAAKPKRRLVGMTKDMMDMPALALTGDDEYNDDETVRQRHVGQDSLLTVMGRHRSGRSGSP